MRTYIDENGKKTRANNYQEAAEKLYGQAKSIDGANTTYSHRKCGCAIVNVWKEGSKIGTYYGAQADTPTTHVLKIVK